MTLYNKWLARYQACLPDGSVSIEVYADQTTTSEAMFTQGSKMFGWIPNAHVKYPVTRLA